MANIPDKPTLSNRLADGEKSVTAYRTATVCC